MQFCKFRHSFLAATLSLGAVAGSAIAIDDLETYISGGTSPADFYWQFENSYISDLQTGSERIKAFGYDKNGIYNNDCTPPNLSSPSYVEKEYLPLLANHMTQVGVSPALILGETSGDLDTVDRYIEFDFSDVTTFSTQAMEAFGMHHKDEWTMHMVASPDLDSIDARGWETLFDIGDENYNGGTQPIRVTVDMDRTGSDTTFRVRTESQGHNAQTSVVVNDIDVEFVNNRPWYQVIVQYYKNTANNGVGTIRIYVNTVKDLSTQQLTTASSNVQSNAWRHDSDGVARIGLDIEDANPFHGAMHHFAVWKGLMGVKYSNDTMTNNLASSYLYSATLTDPDSRTQLAVDWNVEPRYFFWDQPNTQVPLGATRDLMNWNDPLWDRDGTYPLVRHMMDIPDHQWGAARTPPPLDDGQTVHTWNPAPGQTAEDIAFQTANWLDYIDLGLQTHTTKSLADTNACALLWQNYANEDSSGCYYIDRNAARSLMKNWRDAPSIWRNAANHPILPTISNSGSYSEINTPFYREGMSINAFRSKDIFIALREEIDSKGLVTPSRLHMDTERFSNTQQAWGGSTQGTYTEGWWDQSIIESRASDIAQWTPPTGTLTAFSDLFTIGQFFSTATANTWYHAANYGLSQIFERFARDQYDHAFGMGLLQPAVEELDPNIRMSEYNLVFAGTTDDQEYLRSKVGTGVSDLVPEWFDFSSPVLYPIKPGSLIPGTTASDETLFQEWGTRLGVNDLLVTDDLPLNGRNVATAAQVLADARILFVKRALHNINATYLAGGGHDGAPLSPWFPYPDDESFTISQRFDVDGDGVIYGDTAPYGQGGDTLVSTLDKEDIARIVVFAHRHGVREYLFWGNQNNIPNPDSTATGLDYIFDAVDAVVAKPSDMTNPGATTIGDPGFGVPDGIVSSDDLVYFYNAFINPNIDLEADYSGPNGKPDGIINQTDWDDYYAQWLLDL